MTVRTLDAEKNIRNLIQRRSMHLHRESAWNSTSDRLHKNYPLWVMRSEKLPFSWVSLHLYQVSRSTACVCKSAGADSLCFLSGYSFHYHKKMKWFEQLTCCSEILVFLQTYRKFLPLASNYRQKQLCFTYMKVTIWDVTQSWSYSLSYQKLSFPFTLIWFS